MHVLGLGLPGFVLTHLGWCVWVDVSGLMCLD